MALAVGSRIGQYEVLSAIGAGGMGEVYRARDSHLGRDVALKILPDLFAADPERRARFDHEARTVAALNHPNIVTIYSVEERGSTRFLTMEIVEGQTIDALLPPGGLPLPELLRYAIPIVDAVSAAHDRQIVHRDLKPSNVMVTRDGRVKVLDFGLAKFQHAPALDEAAQTMTAGPVTSIGHIVGTSAYMSPEQAEGRRIDHRSDLFSLGILLYEMATGVRPFTGDTAFAVLLAIARDAPKPITQVRPGASRDLERIIDRCLEKDPERRFQSATELRERLGSLAAPLPSSGATAWRLPVLVGAVVLLGAIAAALLLTPRVEPRRSRPSETNLHAADVRASRRVVAEPLARRHRAGLRGPVLRQQRRVHSPHRCGYGFGRQPHRRLASVRLDAVVLSRRALDCLQLASGEQRRHIRDGPAG